MAISNQWLDVDFGPGFAGEATGYQFRDNTGALVGVRVTAGVVDLSNGQYGALVATVPTGAVQVRWDTGGGSPIYAIQDLDTVTRLEGISTTGNIQITIQVNDVLASPIPGAVVSLYDSGNTSLVTTATANGSGLATIALAVIGTYSARVTAGGYSFTSPETVVVAADNDSFTIAALDTVLTPAPDAEYCAMQTTAPLRDAAGNVLANYTLKFIASIPGTAQSSQLHNRIVEVTTDVNGDFSVDLLRGASVYVVAPAIGYMDCGTARVVPDAASQDFATWS